MQVITVFRTTFAASSRLFLLSVVVDVVCAFYLLSGWFQRHFYTQPHRYFDFRNLTRLRHLAYMKWKVRGQRLLGWVLWKRPQATEPWIKFCPAQSILTEYVGVKLSARLRIVNEWMNLHHQMRGLRWRWERWLTELTGEGSERKSPTENIMLVMFPPCTDLQRP